MSEEIAQMARISLIAFTRRGCMLAQGIVQGLRQHAAYAGASLRMAGPARFADELGIDAYESLAAWTADAFAACDALVYVGATGIAVRAIAPHVRDKLVDPAVVSVDEAGAFVVPLLSGHVGGANDLARAVAEIVGGQAVVSTATDVNGLFAVDEWAARRNLHIVERAVAKEISARLLEGGTVGFATDMEMGQDTPPSDASRDARTAKVPSDLERWGIPEGAIGDCADVGFVVSLDDAWHPFARTLHLVPRIVTVGVGCRRGTPPETLERAVDEALAKARVSRHAVCALASIDVKRDEPAILKLAESRGWPARFYTADELAAVPGDFEASDFVRRTVGVDNVCERAACAEGARLILGKQACDGTTVALGK